MSDKYQLSNRTITFSVAVIKHVSKYKQATIRFVVDQVVRSSTSIGANYAEANNASSKTDFKNKIFIAKRRQMKTEKCKHHVNCKLKTVN